MRRLEGQHDRGTMRPSSLSSRAERAAAAASTTAAVASTTRVETATAETATAALTTTTGWTEVVKRRSKSQSQQVSHNAKGMSNERQQQHQQQQRQQKRQLHQLKQPQQEQGQFLKMVPAKVVQAAQTAQASQGVQAAQASQGPQVVQVTPVAESAQAVQLAQATQAVTSLHWPPLAQKPVASSSKSKTSKMQRTTVAETFAERLKRADETRLKPPIVILKRQTPPQVEQDKVNTKMISMLINPNTVYL